MVENHRPDPVRCILFDFDGVVADTEPIGLELDQESYRSLGLDVPFEDAIGIIGTDGVSFVSGLFERYGHPELGPDDYLAHRRSTDLIYRHLLMEPMPGAREVLERLRGLDVKVGLVSTTVAHNLLFALDRLGLLPYFDAIVGGDMVAHRKPAPDPWLTAMAFLGVDPEETIAVDDSPTGIASARAAGLYVAGFRGGSIAQDTSAADEQLASFAAFDLDRGIAPR